MSEDIRKTIRFSKDEIDFIMNDDDLREYGRWGYGTTSFSARLREMIKLYKWQKNRIKSLVSQLQEISEKRAHLSDKSDIKSVGQQISQGEESHYITRKKLIYKTKVEYVKWAINHVKGCLHACDYCYSYMDAKRYGQVQNPEDWRNYQIVINALDLLDKEIPKLKDEIGQDFIHLCFTTDPFMFDASNNALVTDVKMLSLFIIKKLNDHGIRVETLTKGYYPQEVIDFNLSKKNYYGITVTSLDEVFRKYWEKYSAPSRLRIDHLKMLSLYGLKTWASIEPFPTPNIHNQDLDELLNSLSFVDKIVFGQMNYVPDATNYPKRKEFYESCVDQVVNFCEDSSIDWHIKEKTPRPEGIAQTSFLNKIKEGST